MTIPNAASGMPPELPNPIDTVQEVSLVAGRLLSVVVAVGRLLESKPIVTGEYKSEIGAALSLLTQAEHDAIHLLETVESLQP